MARLIGVQRTATALYFHWDDKTSWEYGADDVAAVVASTALLQPQEVEKSIAAMTWLNANGVPGANSIVKADHEATFDLSQPVPVTITTKPVL